MLSVVILAALSSHACYLNKARLHRQRKKLTWAWCRSSQALVCLSCHGPPAGHHEPARCRPLPERNIAVDRRCGDGEWRHTPVRVLSRWGKRDRARHHHAACEARTSMKAACLLELVLQCACPAWLCWVASAASTSTVSSTSASAKDRVRSKLSPSASSRDSPSSRSATPCGASTISVPGATGRAGSSG